MRPAGIVFMAVVFGGVCIAQPATGTPTFEAVSIKVSPPPGCSVIMGASGGPGTHDPGLFRTQNFGLFALIQTAFDTKEYQITANGVFGINAHSF